MGAVSPDKNDPPEFDVTQFLATEEQILQRARHGRCQVCNRDQEHRPAIFKGESYCSENCRKVLWGEA